MSPHDLNSSTAVVKAARSPFFQSPMSRSPPPPSASLLEGELWLGLDDGLTTVYQVVTNRICLERLHGRS